jgi:hypothetical protein
MSSIGRYGFAYVFDWGRSCRDSKGWKCGMWKLSWFYSGSTAEYRNAVTKETFEYVYDSTTSDQRFVVDLRKFRMMKDDDVVHAENGQRKTRRHRLARGSRSKK